jgi:Rad3-related DNA helicase
VEPGLLHNVQGLNTRSVANGACQTGEISRIDCPLFFNGCEYYERVRAARWRQHVFTNYALHISSNRFSEGLGAFDLLTLDEGHVAPQALSDAFTFELSDFEIKSVLRLKNYASMTPTEWSRKGSDLVGWIENRMATAKSMGDFANLHRLKAVQYKVKDLAAYVNSRWVVEETDTGSRKFTPIVPSDFKEFLFNGAGKIVLVSATFNRKILGQLGITEDEVDYFEYDSPFPVKRRPVYLLPTSKLNYESTPQEILQVVQRADQIISRRLDRKGIIPTGSYQRQKFIYEHSKFRELMITPKSAQELPAAIEYFKNCDGPRILVGPNFTTGVDLPHYFCRYVIVPKLPYPSAQGAVYKARCEVDPEYGTFLMASDLVQTMGRGMRDVSDWCEGFILDANAETVFQYSRHLFPKWFLKAVVHIDQIPEAPNYG